VADQDDPFTEIIATGALVLLMGALIAGVIGAAQWGSGSTLTAMVASATAVIGFVVSVACFMYEGRRAEEAATEVPFPSWRRSEADA
jgi:membrane associated rhomboid family serine protease